MSKQDKLLLFFDSFKEKKIKTLYRNTVSHHHVITRDQLHLFSCYSVAPDINSNLFLLAQILRRGEIKKKWELFSLGRFLSCFFPASGNGEAAARGGSFSGKEEGNKTEPAQSYLRFLQSEIRVQNPLLSSSLQKTEQSPWNEGEWNFWNFKI